MVAAFLAAVAMAASGCSDPSLQANRLVFDPNPAVAGANVHFCFRPNPGPDGRTFQWDVGDDGTIDASTTAPEFHALAPHGEMRVHVSYQGADRPEGAGVILQPVEPAPAA